MPQVRVFADTNVILEAFRSRCWTAITTHFAVETVEKCVEETLTGDPADPRHVAVAPAELHAGLTARHPVTRKELAALVTSQPGCMTLDDGEKHLFAWLHASKLDLAIFSGGALASRRTPIFGYGEVVPSEFFFCHPGSIVADDNRFAAQGFR